MNTLLQDIRYGLRMLAKNPGFTATAVLTLALGIGANTAMFSFIDAVALRPLAVQDSGQIVRISNQKITGSYGANPMSSWPEYQEFRANSRALSGIAAADRRGAILRYSNDTRLLLTNVTSPNYFDVLRVRPAVGRLYRESEVAGPNAPHVVVLSYDFWKKQFQGDPQIVGKAINLTLLDCLVVGVLPRDYRGTEAALDPAIYVPLTTWDAFLEGSGFQQYARRDFRELELFGRLRPGATAEQAQTEISSIQQRLAAEYPKTDSDRRITVKLDSTARRDENTDMMRLLFSIAGLLLLIACANVASLLLVRGEARRKEVATRLAMGASRARLLRQSLTETLLLVVIAAGFAFLAAHWVIDLLPALMPPDQAIAYDFRMDTRVLVFAVATSLLAVMLAGLFPAFSAARVSVTGAMKENSAAETGRRAYLRNGLVIAEIAISAVLLIGAGLLIRTLVAVRGQDPGFDAHRKMLIFEFNTGLKTGAQDRVFYQQALQRLPGVPGVQNAAFASRVPMWGGGGGAYKVVWVPGLQPAPGEEGIRVGFATVMGDYFKTIGTRILRGRAITNQDNENTPRVAVVNETGARALWPGQDPVGKHFRDGGPQGRDVEVVGLVPDGRYVNLKEEHRPYMFLAELQQNWDVAVLLVSTAADPRATVGTIRRELQAIDPAIVLLSTTTMDEHMRYALYGDRILVQLVTALGALGLVLAAVGLYGVVAYTVSRRTHEIGIRLAIGAQPRNVFAVFLKRGIVLATLGIGIGLVLAVMLSRYLAAIVYGVSPRDPLTFAGVVFGLVLVAMLASFVPARRATRVDPMVALRYE